MTTYSLKQIAKLSWSLKNHFEEVASYNTVYMEKVPSNIETT